MMLNSDKVGTFIPLWAYGILWGHAMQLETIWLEPSPQGAEASKLSGKLRRRVAARAEHQLPLVMQWGQPPVAGNVVDKL